MKSVFNERLKELREEKGLLQAELAKILNVSKSTISGWEIGRNQPSYDTLIDLARYLEVSTDYLLGNSNYI